ncbi:MAG TPA: ECF-type sigma factor [Nevskiaceae bacterium]|nr:ECF-type sigma factor [Nevskiaceae bacterium]
MGDITQLLVDARSSKDGAREALFAKIYGELQKLARSKLAGAPPITVLDAPALVHEAYLRLLPQNGDLPPAQNRRMFYGYAAHIMRSVIVDALREKRAAKRGAGETKVTLQTRDLGSTARDPDVEALDDALHDLHKIDERCAQVVELRYFGGFTEEQIADALEVSVATIERDWQKARAFLFKALKE